MVASERIKLVRDLTIACPGGDFEQDVEFPWCQRAAHRIGLVAVGAGRPGHMLDEPARGGRRDHAVAGVHGADRLDHILTAGVLEQESARPGPQCREGVLVEIESGQRDHPAPGLFGGDGRESPGYRRVRASAGPSAPRPPGATGPGRAPDGRRRRPRPTRNRADCPPSSAAPTRMSSWSSTMAARMAVMVTPSHRRATRRRPARPATFRRSPRPAPACR